MSARGVIASVAENKQFQIGEQKADAILSALDKAGYAVVPKEPTEAMKRAGGGDAKDKQFLAYAFWTAMISAAKETP